MGGAGKFRAEGAAPTGGAAAHMAAVSQALCGALGLGVAVAAALAWTRLGGLFFSAAQGGGAAPTALGWVALGAPLGLLLALTAAGDRASSPRAARGALLAFAAAQGVGLSALVAAHGAEGLLRALLAAAVAFAGPCTWGNRSRRDLGWLGALCLVALWSMLLAGMAASLAGHRLPATALPLAGLVAFSGLAACATQRIRAAWEAADASEEQGLVALGALELNLVTSGMLLQTVGSLCNSRISLRG